MANENYGGFWFNESENTIALCTLTQTTSGGYDLFYPVLYKVDLKTNIKTPIFPASSEDLSVLITPANIVVDRYERPVLTYNKNTKTFSIAFLLYTTSSGAYMHTIDVLEISRYRAILTGTPTLHVLTLGTAYDPAYTTPPPTVTYGILDGASFSSPSSDMLDGDSFTSPSSDIIDGGSF